MKVRITIDVPDAVRRAFRRRWGQSGMATRQEIRSEMDETWETYTIDVVRENPTPVPEEIEEQYTYGHEDEGDETTMTPTQIVSVAYTRAFPTSNSPQPTMQALLREIVNGELIPPGADDVFEAAVIRECKEIVALREMVRELVNMLEYRRGNRPPQGYLGD